MLLESLLELKLHLSVLKKVCLLSCFYTPTFLQLCIEYLKKVNEKERLKVQYKEQKKDLLSKYDNGSIFHGSLERSYDEDVQVLILIIIVFLILIMFSPFIVKLMSSIKKNFKAFNLKLKKHQKLPPKIIKQVYII